MKCSNSNPGHQLEIGQLVFSKAGRDHGRYYLVYELCADDKYVLLVDGTRRGSQNPKRKNACHLQKTNVICEALKEKVLSKSLVTTAEVKKYLVELSIDQ